MTRIEQTLPPVTVTVTPTLTGAGPASATPAVTSRNGPLPHTMRAAARHEYGDARVVETQTLPVPSPTSRQVLIQVHAAGLDRGVVHLLTGLPLLARLMFGLRRPKQPILGMDVAGTVVAVGDDVTEFLVGDEVMGAADGSFAEYAVASVTALAPRPETISSEDAAAASVSGVTALEAVVDIGKVQPGERVLVIGASGGVGSFATQIAAAQGACVTGVASAAKLDDVRNFGADDVIDYRRDDLSGHTGRYDLIIDIAGRRPLRLLRSLLTPAGRLVIVGGEDGGRITGGLGRQLRAKLWSPFVPQQLTFFISIVDRERVARVAELMTAGTVRSAIGDRVQLDEVGAAIERLESGRSSGKTVVAVGGAS